MRHSPSALTRHRSFFSDEPSAATDPKAPYGRRWAVLIVVLFFVSGCLRIPEESRIISHRWPDIKSARGDQCGDECLDFLSASTTVADPIKRHPEKFHSQLDRGGFTLVSWNIQKGKRPGWTEDFKKFSRMADILILQEAYMDDGLDTLLHLENFQWDMTNAFEYRKIATGVLTAARVPPNMVCMFRQTEPIIRLPKSVLINRYPLAGSDNELLVANIHAINFSIGHKTLTNQMDHLEGILKVHEGPIILSGDFNTWSSRRMARVTDMVRRLDMTAVRFDEDRRSRFFGHDIDHVYYRGLEAVDAKTPMVTTSDHNPLTVTFKMADKAVYVN